MVDVVGGPHGVMVNLIMINFELQSRYYVHSCAKLSVNPFSGGNTPQDTNCTATCPYHENYSS